MRGTLASILAAAGLLASLGSVSSARAAGPKTPIAPITPRGNRKTRGKDSVNYAARAARSHAGKPAGYVKAY